jgi:hypothetical protein
MANADLALTTAGMGKFLFSKFNYAKVLLGVKEAECGKYAAFDKFKCPLNVCCR